MEADEHMSLILVSGATGYIGRHLLNSLLADNLPVRALVHSEWKGEELEDRGVEVVHGDVLDPETLEGIADGVETVYHLVGGGSIGGADPFALNTKGTQNMLDACQGADLKSFVYVSSSTLYGRQPEMVDEDTEPSPRYNYPESKLAAEQVLLDAFETHAFPAKIARMAGVYGPESPMLGVDAVQSGQMKITGPGQNHISVIHIDDAIAALRALAERGRPGQIVCMGDNEPIQYLTFYQHLANLLDAPPIGFNSLRKVRTIMTVVNFLSKLTGRQTPFSPGYVELPTLDVRMDNTRMRQELQVELAYPTYVEGLAQVASLVLTEEEE